MSLLLLLALLSALLMGVWPQFLLQNSVEHQALSLHVQKSSSTVSGAFAIRGVLTKSNIELSLVDECIFGNVLSAGLGQAPARQCALLAGLPPTVVCTTINKVCSSGLKVISFSGIFQSFQLLLRFRLSRWDVNQFRLVIRMWLYVVALKACQTFPTIYPKLALE